MKRKIRREEEKEFKIFRGVFDRRTLLNLYQLLNKGVFKEVIGIVKEGKESVVLVAKTKEGRYLAVKIYRIEACDFKSMWKYLIGDPRFARIKKDRRFVVNVWCQREFKNLKVASNGGVSCPRPIAFRENILVMEFIGEEGIPAPRLIDVKFEDAEGIYQEILEDIKKLTKAGLVHGDLSAYNILLYDKPYMIDLSHGSTAGNDIAPELLERDVKNINSHFSKLKVRVNDSIYQELLKIIEARQ